MLTIGLEDRSLRDRGVRHALGGPQAEAVGFHSPTISSNTATTEPLSARP